MNFGFPNYGSVPKLRFPKFTEDWIKYHLKEIAEKVNNKNNDNKIETVFSNSAVQGIVLQSDYFDKSIANKENLGGYYIVEPFDFVYNPRLSATAEVGAMSVNNTNLTGLVSPLYTVFRVKESNINIPFLEYLFKSKVWHNYMRSIANYGARDDRMNVRSDDFYNLPLFIPSLSEQKTVSTFLSLIEGRIQTQKKIIEDLIILKSNTAQNIFNQVFKFKDSEGIGFPNWQIKKLGDVCEIKRGASPRPISDSKWFDEDSKIGWVRISDVTKSEKYLEKTEQYLSSAGISKSRLVKKGNMIMSICATIGKPIYTNFDVCIHDGFVVFENLTLDKEFLYYYLDFIQLNWYKYGQPGIQVNLNSEIVNNESVVVPVIEEQIKIAEFLSKFDEKIKLENELLTQYENQKKYLLQNLFV